MRSRLVNIAALVALGCTAGWAAPAVPAQAEAKLRAAGFVLRPVDGEPGSIVARLPVRSAAAGPVVVWAARSDPAFTEAALVASLAAAKDAAPRVRDVVVVLGDVLAWQAAELVPDAPGGIALMGQGAWQLRGAGGTPWLLGVQRDEKQRLVARLAAHGRPGSPAQPPRDQAAVRLAHAVARVAEHRFPEQVNQSTQLLFAQVAAALPAAEAAPLRVVAEGVGAPRFAGAAQAVSADPRWGEQLRTTCAVVNLETPAGGGVPATAAATVDCRLVLPDTPSRMAWGLVDITQDPRVVVERLKEPEPPPPSPAAGVAWDAIVATAARRHPGAAVVAWVSLEPTDAPALRAQGLQAYGLPPALADAEALADIVSALARSP